MQHPDVPLELLALWRRVALLEEDNRQKSSQISALSLRLDQLESRLNGSASAMTDFSLGQNLYQYSPIDAKPFIPAVSSVESTVVDSMVRNAASHPDFPDSRPPSFDYRDDTIVITDRACPDLPRTDLISRRSSFATSITMTSCMPFLEAPSADESLRDKVAVALMNSNVSRENEGAAPSSTKDDVQKTLLHDLDLQPILDTLPEFLSTNLYLHQKVGAAFLSTVLKQNTGTIFADALGLGKTLQVLSALYLFCSGDYHKIAKPKVLILTPLTVVPHWMKEVARFNTWLPAGAKCFSDPYVLNASMSPSFRTDVVERWVNTGGLMVLSYSMFLELAERKRDSRLLRTQPGPDVVILDEGHRLCNDKSAIHSSLNVLRTQRRIVVSGYPLQNHLRELFSLLTYVNKPKCLALFKSRQNFIYLYEKVINGLRQTKPEISKKRAFVLYEMIRKNRLFFRRDNHFLKSYLPRKTEIVITIRFSELQRSLWANCLETRNGLDGVTLHSVATMISDHPQIARRQVDLETNNPYQETLAGLDPNRMDLDSSGKMVFLMVLLQLCKASGEKVVVFSRWIKALSFVEEMVDQYNARAPSKISAFRVDGGTTSVEREALISDFNSASSEADCFLISTLCGEGISLVAASRVVILEPSWNPSHDFQAAYRVYRIGQRRPVFIYRLLMGEMFEDLVFQRQLEKIETSSWVMDATHQEVANRVATQWNQFIKPPPRLDELAGPTQVSLSEFALSDSITCSLVNRLCLRSGGSFAEAPGSWILSAIEHSKYFDDHAELRQAPDLDAVMAFEELEYDRVYTHGTPARDSTLIDNVRRLTSVSVVDQIQLSEDDDTDHHDQLEPEGFLVKLSADANASELIEIPESCLKPLQPSAIPQAAIADPKESSHGNAVSLHPPWKDGLWHAAAALPAPDRRQSLHDEESSDSDRKDVDGRRPSIQVDDGKLDVPLSDVTGSKSNHDALSAALSETAFSTKIADDEAENCRIRPPRPAPNAPKRRFEPVKCVHRQPKVRRPNTGSNHRRNGDQNRSSYNKNSSASAYEESSSNTAFDLGSTRRYQGLPARPYSNASSRSPHHQPARRRVGNGSFRSHDQRRMPYPSERDPLPSVPVHTRH